MNDTIPNSINATNPINQQPVSPTTTVQQDKTLQGQRKVNLIWEFTQAIIAVSVIGANLIVGVHFGLSNISTPVPSILSNSMFLIIGFYFSRTNHQAIGGIGRKTNEEQGYEGR